MQSFKNYMNKFSTVLKKFNSASMLSYFLAALFSKAVAFLTIPIFTRMLTTAEYGVVNTYTSAVAIASFVVGLSLQNAINGIIKDEKFDYKQYQSAVMTLSLLFFIVMAVFAYGFKLLFLKDISDVVFIAGIIQSYATFVIAFISIEWRLHNRYIGYTLLNVLPSFLAIIVSIWAISQLNSEKYLGRIVPTMLIQTIAALGCMIYIWCRGKKFFSMAMWKTALAYCLPLIMHTISLLILEQSDRIMVASISGLSEAGIYGFTHSFALAIQVVFVALDNVWASTFVTSMKNKLSTEDINKKAKSFTEIYTLFVIGFIFVSPELVKLMADKDYWSGIVYIPLFVLASYVNLLYTFPVNNEYYESQTKSMAKVSLIAAVINIVLNIVVIPFGGGAGAAFTTLLTYVFLFFVHWRNSKKLNKDLFPLVLFKNTSLLVLAAVAIYYLLFNLWIARWILIAIFTVVYVWKLYKKYIKTV